MVMYRGIFIFEMCFQRYVTVVFIIDWYKVKGCLCIVVVVDYNFIFSMVRRNSRLIVFAA